MLKTYRNTQLGIEIDVPENWLIPSGEATKTPFGESIIFYCGTDENFNIEIGPSFSEALDQIEREFRRYAQGRQYTALEFGKILVDNKDHLYARYRMGSEDWAKKYMIVAGKTEYDMTANCFAQQTFAEREAVWDTIVKSFRLIAPIAPRETTDIFDRIYQAATTFEKGYGYFRSGHFQQALEQFEKGKTITHEYPSNFFGVSMTLMQMIEVGAIPEDQIRLTVRNAEKNLEICLLISPKEQDYVEAMKVIQEFKKIHDV